MTLFYLKNSFIVEIVKICFNPKKERERERKREAFHKVLSKSRK